MNEINRLAWVLIHFVWQGALVAVLYALARQCMAQRASRNARYLLAWAALALMSVAPLLTWIEMLPARPVPAVHADVVLASLRPAAAVAAGGLPAVVAARRELVPLALLPWIVALWCAGALLGWVRLTVGWLFAARLRATRIKPASGEWQAKFARLQARMGVSQPVRLLVSARVTAPAVVGWLRPVVLAPVYAFTGLPPEQLEVVLLHELAHIRRRDYLVNLWQNAVEAILFYHPAVWWVSGHMRAEREFCCDDAAVAASGDALGYVRALEKLEATRPRKPALAMAASGGSLLRRIARLVGPSNASPPAGRGMGAPVLLAGTSLLCLIGVLGWSQVAPAAPALEVASVKPSRQPWSRTGGPGGPSRMAVLPAPCGLAACTAASPTPVKPLYVVSTRDAGSQLAALSAPQTTPPLKFDAVSVKPVKSSRPGNHLHTRRDPINFRIEGSLHNLIIAAYGIGADQLGPAPQWVSSNQYSIQAVSSAPATRDQQLLMLREVLADRFHLELDSHERDFSAYDLTVASGGPKFKPLAAGEVFPKVHDTPNTYIDAFRSVADLVKAIDSDGSMLTLGRIVVDKTGLDGEYNIVISTAIQSEPGLHSRLPNLATDIESELGLRLTPSKAPLPYYTIESVSLPTGN